MKKILCRTFDKSVVFCARNSVLVTQSIRFFKTDVDKSYYTNFTTYNSSDSYGTYAYWKYIRTLGTLANEICTPKIYCMYEQGTN